ncbi:MAG: TolC family protein [Magnetococcales bacterium]|nr:TolC family protein [Magnetococcales bacterium]
MSLGVWSWPTSGQAEVMAFWRAVDTAQARNPQIHKSEALLRAAREDNPKTLAKLLPLVNLKAVEVLRQGTHYSQRGVQQHSDPKTVTLTVDQKLFDAPFLVDHFQSGVHVEAAYADAMAMRQEITLRVATITSNWLEAKEVLALALQYKKITQHHMRENKLRLDAGESTQTDLDQASSRANQAEASYQDALNTLEKETAFFREVVGADPDSSISLPEYSWKEPEDLQANLWKWIEDRPEIWAARARLKESSMTESMSRMEHLPTVNLNYTASHTWDAELGGTTGRSIKDDENAHSVSLALNMPLFSGFENLAKTREAKAIKEGAMADLDRLRSLARREVEEARFDLKNNKTAIVSLEKALSFSEKASTGLEESFLAGTRTLLDLLDSQFEVHTLRTTLVRHRYQAQLALMRLWKGLGRLVHPASPARPATHEESTDTARAGRDEVIDAVYDQMRLAMMEKESVTHPASASSDPKEMEEGIRLLLNEQEQITTPTPTLSSQARPLNELHAAADPTHRAPVNPGETPLTFNPSDRPLPRRFPILIDDGGFMVHVGSFMEEASLTTAIKTLSGAGIPSWSEKIATPDEKIMTRLLVGPFATHGEVLEAMSLINRQTGHGVGWIPVNHVQSQERIRLHLHRSLAPVRSKG